MSGTGCSKDAIIVVPSEMARLRTILNSEDSIANPYLIQVEFFEDSESVAEMEIVLNGNAKMNDNNDCVK